MIYLFRMVYQYKAKNRLGDLEEYSKEYDNLCEAINWYNKNGKWLEDKFNRTLILTTKQTE